MPAPSFTWDDLSLVLATADARGLGPAAERLGVNASTVFRRLGQLERRLGLRLFERHRSGYVPTPAGDEMAGLARRMDAEVAGLSTKLAGQSTAPSGLIRVTTNDAMLADLVAPVLAEFRRRQPSLALEILISNEELNLSRRDADIAIRPTAAPPDTLVGRQVGTFGWAVYAAASRVPAGGLAEADWPSQDWVGLTDGFDKAAPSRFLAEHVEPARVVCRVNSMLGFGDAVEAGLGLGLLPDFMGAVRPGLVRLGAGPSTPTPLWILTHPHLQHAPRVRAFMDFAGSAIAARLAARGA